jgi:hypothetical protein
VRDNVGRGRHRGKDAERCRGARREELAGVTVDAACARVDAREDATNTAFHENT